LRINSSIFLRTPIWYDGSCPHGTDYTRGAGSAFRRGGDGIYSQVDGEKHSFIAGE
jgi:hypothetical protein